MVLTYAQGVSEVYEQAGLCKANCIEDSKTSLETLSEVASQLRHRS